MFCSVELRVIELIHLFQMIHMLCGEIHLHGGETDFLHWLESPPGQHATQQKQKRHVNSTYLSLKRESLFVSNLTAAH